MSAAHSFLTISLATVLFSVAPLSCASTADIISRLKIAPVIEGRFIQKEKLVSVPKPFECEVFLYFWKDDVLLWKATKPILTTSLYTDQNFKTYIHLNGKRIENTSPSATNIVNRILWGLLSADMTALELDFQIFSQNKPESWKMDFYPKSNMTGSIVKHVSVTGKDTPEKIVVENFSSDITTLIIDEIKLSEISSTQQENELANP